MRFQLIHVDERKPACGDEHFYEHACLGCGIQHLLEFNLFCVIGKQQDLALPSGVREYVAYEGGGRIVYVDHAAHLTEVDFRIIIL